MSEKLLPVIIQPNQTSRTRTAITAHQNIGSKTLQVCGIELHSWWTLTSWGERLGSGDGEHKTLLTRQIAFEPLPASVLFALGWMLWLLMSEVDVVRQ
jgi:hypothetical protein